MNAPPPPKRSIGLASWLGGGSVIVVLAAVAAIAIACSLILDRLVADQALTRVQLAAASSREALRRMGEDVLSDARVLAERPTLQRLLTTSEPPEAIEFFLRRYCESSGSDVCGVVGPNGLVAAVGTTVDWGEIATANDEQGDRFLLAPRTGSAPIWGASAAVLPVPGTRAIALRFADAQLVRELGQQAGAQIGLENFASYVAAPNARLTALHGAALKNGRSAVMKLPGEDTYAASIVVSAASGEVIGLLSATLDGREFTDTVTKFNRVLTVTAIVVVLVAGLAGLLYGRWLARPVVALRDVAARIGQGDFSASIPPIAPYEVGALARSMDEMRQNLIDLTQTLRRREAEAQAVLEGIVEGVYSVDLERRIRYVNPQTARLLGRSADQLLGQFCGDVLQPRAVNGKRPCDEHCPIFEARTAGHGRAAETLCLASGAARSVVIVSAAPVAGQQVQVIRDETELEAARRARDSVLGNISHEFRTPLAAQLASIELLRDGLETLPPANQRELLANVERGVLRLMRLIDNLLEGVRIEAGQLAIRSQSVQLSQVIQEAIELLEPLLDQRHLQLHQSLDAALPSIEGDSQRLVQVFVNLLSNAIKFSPERGTIRVSAQRVASELHAWVEDEGPGLASENASTIFERFRRGDGTEPDVPGLGLGLSIAKSIVERHQGRIWVERTTEGRTRFSIALPCGVPA